MEKKGYGVSIIELKSLHVHGNIKSKGSTLIAVLNLTARPSA